MSIDISAYSVGIEFKVGNVVHVHRAINFVQVSVLDFIRA